MYCLHNLRDDMCRSNQVDIVAAPLLKGKHHLCHLSSGCHLSIAQLADGVVLAKHTSQVAVGEKDRPRAI